MICCSVFRDLIKHGWVITTGALLAGIHRPLLYPVFVRRVFFSFLFFCILVPRVRFRKEEAGETHQASGGGEEEGAGHGSAETEVRRGSLVVYLYAVYIYCSVLDP